MQGLGVALALLCAFVARAAGTSLGTTLRVCADGSGDFASVQAAVDALARGPAPAGPATLLLTGRFRERVAVFANISGGVVLRGVTPCGSSGGGASPIDAAYIVFNASATHGTTPAESATLGVFADDFSISNVCVGNDAAGFDKEKAGQSLALYLSGDRAVVSGAQLLGGQDTLLTGQGRSLFANTFINGSCDSIYGFSSSLFRDCALEIYDTVTAHAGNGSTAYVFEQCDVHPAMPRSLLGRPWGANATVVFKSCDLSANIDPAGWSDWNKNCTNRINPAACAGVFYAEHDSRGPGANTSGRVWWSRQLNASEAALWSETRLFGDWVPALPPPSEGGWRARGRRLR